MQRIFRLIVLFIFSIVFFLFFPLVVFADGHFTASNVHYNPATSEVTFDATGLTPSATWYDSVGIGSCNYEINCDDSTHQFWGPSTYFTNYQQFPFSEPQHIDVTFAFNSYRPSPGTVYLWIQTDGASRNYSQALDYNTITGTVSDLNVLLLKQTDPTWGSQEYDSGFLWAPGHGTIANYGCAITSAAMVFKYYGITKLPDNTDLDPVTLNAWLKSQPDGYVGEGLLNWLALTRLSKISTLNNPGFSYDALQFSRAGSDKTLLTNDINNNQPDILEEPGHFIVGKGVNGTTFDINDPYFNRNDLNNTAYNNSFLSLERFIPSHTNLSYLLFTVDPGVDLVLTNSNGQKVGDSFTQQGINDPLTNIVSPNLKELMVPVPTDGEYVVSVNSNSKTSQNFTLNSYAYTASGSALMETDTGSAKNNQPSSFVLTYQQDPSSSFIGSFCTKGVKLSHGQRSFCHLLRKINR